MISFFLGGWDMFFGVSQYWCSTNDLGTSLAADRWPKHGKLFACTTVGPRSKGVTSEGSEGLYKGIFWCKVNGIPGMWWHDNFDMIAWCLCESVFFLQWFFYRVHPLIVFPSRRRVPSCDPWCLIFFFRPNSWETFFTVGKHIAGWWFYKYFLFSPLFGEDSHFDCIYDMFQLGWNHQLDRNNYPVEIEH